MATGTHSGPPPRIVLGLLVIVAGLLVVTAVRATGGGGPNFGFDPPGDFRAAAGDLCHDQARAAADTQIERGQASTEPEAVANQRAIASSNAGFDGAFGALEVPD